MIQSETQNRPVARSASIPPSAAPLLEWKWASVMGAIAAYAGLAGLLGWVLNVPYLAKIHPESVMISLRMAFLAGVLGGVFFWTGRSARPRSNAVLRLSGILALVVGFSNRYAWSFVSPIVERVLLGNISIWDYLYRDRMSWPADQAVIVLGILVIGLSFADRIPQFWKDGLGVVSILLGVFFAVDLLGYSYGTPLAGVIQQKPVSFLGSLALTCLFLCVVFALGHRTFPMRPMMGPSIQARLLRTFLPVGTASILTYVILEHSVFGGLHPALSSFIAMFLATVLAAFIIMNSAQTASGQIEHAVRDSEKRFTILVDSLKEHAMSMLDTEGYVMTWNKVAERQQGYRAEEIIGQSIERFYTPEDVRNGVLPESLRLARENGTSKSQGWRVRKDGTRFWGDMVLTAMHDEQGKLRGFVHVLRDVTDRRNAEEALHQKTLLGDLLRVVSVALNEQPDTHRVLQFVLREVCLRLGWSAAHVVWVSGENHALVSGEWYVPSFSESDPLERELSLDTHRARYAELQRVVANKQALSLKVLSPETIPIHAARFGAPPLRSDYVQPVMGGGDVVALLEFFSYEALEPGPEVKLTLEQIARQIGLAIERNMHEQEVRISLREKELLLKEIHHRVKNNLQIVVSLLRLQSSKIRDSDSLHVFTESQNRVRSMALIHEYLYQSTDLARIRFSGYLRNLVMNLIRSYGVGPDKLNAAFNLSDVQLNLDYAVPCGLIVTELVTNVLKYAFPNGQKGHLQVSFEPQGDRRGYVLKVEDDGKGLPSNVKWDDPDSLGLRLVKALASQMDGQVQCRTEEGKGTSFSILFTVADKGG